MTVHYLRHGYALCRFTNKLPSNWPEEHHWVEVGEEIPLNAEACLKCVDIAVNLAEPPIHVRILVGFCPQEFVKGPGLFAIRVLLKYEGPDEIGNTGVAKIGKHTIAHTLMNQQFEMDTDFVNLPLWEWEGVVDVTSGLALQYEGQWHPVTKISDVL